MDEYKELKETYEAEREYVLSTGKHTFAPGEIEAAIGRRTLTNEERSALEKEELRRNPPKRYLVYVAGDMKHITTWMGDELGRITTYGEPWRSNMGDERINIDVLLFDRIPYYGTYYKSAGDYAIITARKGAL